MYFVSWIQNTVWSYSRSIVNQIHHSSVIIIITITAYHCSLFNLYQTVTASYIDASMKIIFPAVKDYTLSLIFANVDTLESRRERFFRRSVLRKSFCLHYLLPDKRDSVITYRLRHPKTFKSMLMKTELISQFICTILSQTLGLAQLLRITYYIRTPVADIEH